MPSVRAERSVKIPAEPSPELRMPGAAAQTRMVSMAEIRRGSGKSARAFKGIICDAISKFESHMPSHAVGSLWAMVISRGLTRRWGCGIEPRNDEFAGSGDGTELMPSKTIIRSKSLKDSTLKDSIREMTG